MEVLLIYVDYMVIMSESHAEVEKTKRQLKEYFNITDLGPLSFFLGISFERSNDGNSMIVTQDQYTLLVLEQFVMGKVCPAPTAMTRDFFCVFFRSKGRRRAQTFESIAV